jgi:hypothetical protein
MKKLEDIIRKKGFIYTLVKRSGNVAIYEQQMEGITNPQTHYEVVVISRHNGIKIANNYLPPSELYPSSSQWGNTGWTYQSKNEAESKFATLVKLTKNT